MKDTASETTRILLDVLERQGVRNIVLSPGSRNAPLLISCSQRKKLKKTIIPDERTAAFTALGMATVSGELVALACTSGTALYNYAPAVAEAFYRNIPLIVISADRPSQWIDQDDSQTLVQFGALERIVKGSFNLPVDSTRQGCANPDYHSEGEWFANRTANEAMMLAKSGIPGPVHINLQLDTPLGAMMERPEVSVPDDYTERIIRNIENPSGLPPHMMERLAETLHDKKIMLVAGFMAPSDAMNRAVKRFATLSNVTVLAETLSNLHLSGNPYLIDGILTRLDANQKEKLRPDIVISIGGALVSRMLKEYLRGCMGTVHWTLGDTPTGRDVFQRLTTHIDASPERFLYSIAGYMDRIAHKSGVDIPAYGDAWRNAKEEILPGYDEELKECGWSELKAVNMLCNALAGTSCNLFLSNGTTVRYAQLCTRKLPHACFGNRGVSGIDGTNATAYGAALEYAGTTVLLTGDMSFLYCPQILQYDTGNADLRIVVINNSGGGIFRFIAQTRSLEMREEYFCAPSEPHISGLAGVYGWNYLRAESEKEMEECLAKLIKTPRSILEVCVDEEYSAKLLCNFLRVK